MYFGFKDKNSVDSTPTLELLHSRAYTKSRTLQLLSTEEVGRGAQGAGREHHQNSCLTLAKEMSRNTRYHAKQQNQGELADGQPFLRD